MTIDPVVAGRFTLLDGITSPEQFMADPQLEARFHEFMQWRDAAPGPDLPTRETSAPGLHGPVRVRMYGADAPGARRPCLIWQHGGAFMMGDIDMPEADRVAREICVRADAVVLNVDYRLAVGGVRYPVPLDDCVAALRWARDNADPLGIDPGRIAVGGASAGGNLATGATLRLRDEDGWLPASLIPVYGVFHPGLLPASPRFTELMSAVPEVLRFRPGFVADIDANYIGGPASAIPGYAMPALADLTGLCPTLVVNAEYDDLRPSGEAFTALLATAGVDVQQVLARGMLHGFLNLPAEIGPVGLILDLIAEQVAQSRKPLPV